MRQIHRGEMDNNCCLKSNTGVTADLTAEGIYQGFLPAEFLSKLDPHD